ncbi:SmpA/OmlA family protein [Mesocricetibacter intestinalis]|uniref:SmpA/OmlA family protein n=1 Tax=Mesocricetibacter intestinalis TaxID=1521930 RepID=A0A4R6V783_9PAST|nr:OmpA family protein [Mesocricetibacter intestinalis]TDQ57223.1 SmpA/OmlA family protein [Mesocricetibacter intestinalis]
MFNSKLKQLAVLIGAMAALSACTTAGTNVKSDGTTDKVVWPKAYDTTFDKDRGTFPNVQSLKEIRAGMTKDQLYALIGRPQYGEGFRVREWDYLFHFNTPGVGKDDITTCQYKVLFDKDSYARSFYWKAVEPVDAACGGAEKAMKRYTLSADALFSFNKGDIGDMNAKGRAELDRLASELSKFDQLNSVRITGHTDLLGSESYNRKLSQRRAETVRLYLAQRGIPANVMIAYGAGKSQPVKQCSNKGNKAAYIQCLQPNRRVEVEVDGSGIAK